MTCQLQIAHLPPFESLRASTSCRIVQQLFFQPGKPYQSHQFKSAKRYGVSELGSQSVSDKHCQWSDSGPIKNTQFHFNDLDSVLAWWRCGEYSTSGHVVRWGGNSEAGNRFHIASSAGTLLSRCLKVTPIGSISWYFELKAKWVIQFNWVDGPWWSFGRFPVWQSRWW